jgi:hypothetical protein
VYDYVSTLSTNLSFSGASSPVTLNSSTGTDVRFLAGSGVSLSTSGNDMTVTATDNSITNENLTIVVGANSENLGGQTLNVTGTGIAVPTYNTGTNTLNIAATEVDGSVTNEIQSLSLSGQTLSISGGGTSATLPIIGVAASTGISVSTSSGTATVTNTSPSKWTLSGSDVYNTALGSVGIGTTSFLAKLRVVGSAANTGASIEAGAVADFGSGLNVTASGANIYGVSSVVTATGNGIHRFQNSSTGASATSIVEVTTNGSASSDPYTRYSIASEANASFSVGIKNQDANKFRITPATSLGTNEGGLTITRESPAKFGINEETPLVTMDLAANTDAIGVPKGTAAQRPTAADGYMRHNTDFDGLEYSNGSNWHRLTNNGLSALPSLVKGDALGSTGTTSGVGSDMAGILTLTCGTSPAAAGTDVVTATYGTSFNIQPYVALTAHSANFYDAGFYIQTNGSGSFSIRAKNVLVSGQVYKVGYQIQN